MGENPRNDYSMAAGARSPVLRVVRPDGHVRVPANAQRRLLGEPIAQGQCGKRGFLFGSAAGEPSHAGHARPASNVFPYQARIRLDVLVLII